MIVTSKEMEFEMTVEWQTIKEYEEILFESTREGKVVKKIGRAHV